jgi:hypothetical protein
LRYKEDFLRKGLIGKIMMTVPHRRTQTETLWKAIAMARCTRWAKEAVFAPKAAAWDDWLIEAKEAANAAKIVKREAVIASGTGKRRETWTIPSWDAKKALRLLLEPDTSRTDAV